MFEKARAWWAQRKRRDRELDREYAADERALIDDPDGLGAELENAEDAALMRNRPLRRLDED